MISINKCEGILCGTDYDCASGSCIAKSCSNDKNCGTHLTSEYNKCDATKCIGNEDCKSFNGNKTCIMGYCSKFYNCATSPMAASKRCKAVDCTEDSQCFSNSCRSGLCVDNYYDSKKGSSLALMIFIPLLILIVIGGVI